jgi:type IX secretion system substrate protein
MNKKAFTIAILTALIVLISSVVVYTYPGGITGRTKMTSTSGCGSCHSLNTNITSAITGPDTVTAGSTVNFTFTVTRSGSSAKAGCDIAARLGTLGVGPSGSYLRLSGGELTQAPSNGLTLTNGTFSCQFAYTAPSSPGIDTIWLTSAVGHSNGWNWGIEKSIVIRPLTGINSNNSPLQFKLNQNYPNPFNPSTTISFELPSNSDVKISIYDINGKHVETLVNSPLQAGAHEVIWNASAYASGVYIYKIETDTYSEVKKMMLIK